MVKGEKLSEEDQKSELQMQTLKIIDQSSSTVYEEDTEDFLFNINW